MAVPGHDARDHAFARTFGLPDHPGGGARRRRDVDGRGLWRGTERWSTPASWTAWRWPRPSSAMIAWLEQHGAGAAKITLPPARLAVLAAALLGRADSDPASEPTARWCRCRRTACRCCLPELEDYTPAPRWRVAACACDGLGAHHGCLARASRRCARPTRCRNGPARAGTICGSSIRTTSRPWSIRRPRNTGCRSTSTSAAPSTPCCTCSTRGSGTRCCTTSASSRRPSRSRLFNQGMILAFSYRDAAGRYYEPAEVSGTGWAVLRRATEALTRQSRRCAKSRFNVVNPDDVVERVRR